MVGRFGRRSTVHESVGVLTALGATVAGLLLVPADTVPWAVAPALLVGGLGGGCVISPTITMTLREVPVRMAGAAGGGLQTAQRFGAVIGTAALPGLFYVVLGATARDYPAAAAAGLAVALAGIAAALVLAVVDLRRTRQQEAADRADRDHDAVHGHGHAAHS